MFIKFGEATINTEHLLFYYVGQLFDEHALFAAMRGRESDLPLLVGSHRACVAAWRQLDKMLFADEAAETAVPAPAPQNGTSDKSQLSAALRPLWAFIDPKYQWLSWSIHFKWQVHEAKPRYRVGWVCDGDFQHLGGIQVSSPLIHERGFVLLQRPCPHDPTNEFGGMYHCPECGEMVVAGVPHPTWEMIEEAAVSPTPEQS